MQTVFRFLKTRGLSDEHAALLAIAITAALIVHPEYAQAILTRLPKVAEGGK